MNANKPVVFVSSTIYDFRDLRSAIKFWLEQHGYEVRMSEFNDFPQKPEENSYNSCLQAIDDSHFFILLIGTRVGGMFDEEKKISITREEYRYAYERAKKGKTKLITFVRKEVWDVREDRNELRRFLISEEAKELCLTPGAVRTISNHPSKFANDPDAIFEFLQEVKRIPEIKKAIANKGELPSGNWINQFVTFQDVTDALKASMRIAGTLQLAAMVANLKNELIANLRCLLSKEDDGGVYSITRDVASARKKLTGGMADESELTGHELGRLGIFLMMYCDVGNTLSTFAIHEAITSGHFLHYNLLSSGYEVGRVQRSLLEMAEFIRLLRRNPDKFFELGGKLVGRHNGFVSDQNYLHKKKNSDLSAGFILHDRIYNITKASVALYNFLVQGDERHLIIIPFPNNPYQEEARNIAQATPSSVEIQSWIEGDGSHF